MGLTLTHNQSEGSLVRMLRAMAGVVVGGGFRPGDRRRVARSGKYTGEQLREIRARKGVGRPIGSLSMDRIQELRWRGAKFYPASAFAGIGAPSPNMHQWVMKPRKTVR
jgi:hypothetical protein